MDAAKLEAKETVSASRKLGRDRATELLESSTRLLVAKGRNVREWKTGGKATDDTIAAMLGPTGNLRAPTIVVGKTIVVGFDATMFDALFG